MDAFWYCAALLLAKTIEALPLRVVARLGRFSGGLAYWIDGRHRRVASENMRRCLPELSAGERRAFVHEHYRRLGENYASAVKTSFMSRDELRPHLEIVGEDRLAAHARREAIAALGHFGNFELYAHMASDIPGARRAATYRGLKQPRLDQLVRRLRNESGCQFFDRKKDSKALRAALREGGIMLGLLCDLHAGRSGLPLRFLNQECSVSTAPAVFALRYNLPLHVAICYRTGLAKWRIEISEQIPTCADGRRRDVADITADINSAFEVAVRRDPPNWFWVHDRWRFVKRDRAMARASLEAEVARRNEPNPEGLASGR